MGIDAIVFFEPTLKARLSNDAALGSRVQHFHQKLPKFLSFGK